MSGRRLQLSSKARDMLVLVLVNVIVRTTWLLYAHPAQRADFQWYFVRATELARGQGYTANGVPTAYWPMGWPFFLSLVFRVTGSSVVVGLMVNAALSIGIVLLVYVAALKLWASRRICVAAALAYTLLPSQVEWNSILESEELFTCLALASLVVYGMKGRPTWAHRVTSGVLMGLACDVRPVGLLFFIMVFAYERWVNRTGTMTSAARTFVYTIAMIAAIAPMTLSNWIVFHHFILVSTNGGVNLWQGTHANGDYYWSYDPAVNPLLAAGTNEIAENAIGIWAAVAIYIHYPWSMLGNAMI